MESFELDTAQHSDLGALVLALQAENGSLRRKLQDREDEDALREARAELAQVTRLMSMGQLTACIAHEVNQPLGAMVTSAASGLRWLAAAPPNLAKAQRALERIAADGERASAMIDGMRRLVDRLQPHREPLGVNDVMHRVMEVMRRELERARIEVQTRLAEDLPTVPGDRVLLQQVVFHLILNAIDAMRETEGRPRTLRIASRLEDGGVRVEVRDAGCGFPADARLFEAFYTTKAGGMGMGLPISRSIVESHGGRMHARRDDPHGSIFEFSLPLGGGAAA